MRSQARCGRDARAPGKSSSYGITSNQSRKSKSCRTPSPQDYPTLIFLSPGGLILVDLGDLQAVRAWEMGVIRAL